MSNNDGVTARLKAIAPCAYSLAPPILMSIEKGIFWEYDMNKTLNILITAGGTSEKIDDVRRITNSGTGRLGACIAEAFAASGRECRIVYICSAGAVRPRCAVPEEAKAGNTAVPIEVQAGNTAVHGEAQAGNTAGPVEAQAGNAAVSIDVRIADDVAAVESAVVGACAETAFDAIVHSMAISDYRVKAVSDASLMAGAVLERLSVLACGDSASPDEAVLEALLSPPELIGDRGASKISSDRENLVVVLEKAPKIIALLRGLAPNAVIVGFKLLSNADEKELVQAGHSLLVKNDCDYVLANDMRTVRADSQYGASLHEGLLVAKDGTYERATGKEAIAALILRRILE